MRRRTVRSGLRLLQFAVLLLILGTFYGQQINALLAVGGEGAVGFVRLAFFWGAVLGAAAILVISFGLLQRSRSGDAALIMPSVVLLCILLAVFCLLFYRSLSSPPTPQPLRPGETLII